MKKILSVILATVLMFAICIPAFATKSITDKTDNSATTLVKTSTDREDGSDGASYTVRIPAETVIPWGKDSINLTYYAEAHLHYGQKLRVTVIGSGKMALYEDANEKLAYTLGGATEFVSERPVVNPGVNNILTLAISKNAWANAIVGEYSDTLTFIAETV